MRTVVLLCVVATALAIREPNTKTCSEEPETGPCYAWFPSFYFDSTTGTCKPFIYGGCSGNGNRYQTEEECLENCASQRAVLDRPDCDKAPDSGLCEAYMPRYYYDQAEGMCKTFIYGGCGGNRNNFRTEEECYNKCGALLAPSACDEEKEVGPCKALFPRYYYNKHTGECELFHYGGCAGNENNFHRKEVCEAVCVASRILRAPAKCSLKPDTGICKGHFPRYYYDPKADTCKLFTYGGCGGNGNNFESEGECLVVCSD